jgi:shikimate kinase
VTTGGDERGHPLTSSIPHPLGDATGRDGVVRRVVLLGLPGAGKSTVGPRLAERLGWEFVDLDARIEQRAARAVPEIFAAEGEAGFRAWELRCTDELADSAKLVLAPGGGWITTPGILDRLGPGTVAVWLQVSPGAALERLAHDAESRPLLQVSDPTAALARLLRERKPLYHGADLHILTEGRAPDEIVRDIESRLAACSGASRGSDTQE